MGEGKWDLPIDLILDERPYSDRSGDMAPCATHKNGLLYCYAVDKLFLQAAYQIRSRIFFFFNMSFAYSVLNLDVPARARRENGHYSPFPRSTVQNMPAVLSSGVGSDRTRPNRLDLWNLNGSDPIGSDRSFEFRCRTAAEPERKGAANLLPRGPGCLLTLSRLF